MSLEEHMREMATAEAAELTSESHREADEATGNAAARQRLQPLLDEAVRIASAARKPWVLAASRDFSGGGIETLKLTGTRGWALGPEHADWYWFLTTSAELHQVRFNYNRVHTSWGTGRLLAKAKRNCEVVGVVESWNGRDIDSDGLPRLYEPPSGGWLGGTGRESSTKDLLAGWLLRLREPS